MKAFTTIMKILAALAAVAAIVYVAVKYGDAIIAWLKKQLAKFGICCGEEAELYEVDGAPEEAEEEAPAAEEETAEEPAVQAEEVDFEKE
ncbi:MAG: hypothetical protein IKU07_00040 [Oscillospiraceae bacterium]|nr:hypothetical protein [Oscillospiraceae bacterium]